MDRVRALLRWVKRRGAFTRYALVTVVVLITFLARLALEPWLSDYPFVLFFPAVVATGLIFEKGTGFYATGLSAVLAVYFFMAPRDSFSIRASDMVALFIFVVSASLVTVLTEAFRVLSDKLDGLEREKSLLLGELHHRTRNNLQIISSTLAIEGAEESDPHVRDKLQAVAERVGKIGRLQQHLFAPGVIELVAAPAFLDAVCEDVELALVGQRPVAIHCRADNIPLERDFAAGLGIIINELVTNALKHAFPGGRSGDIRVRLMEETSGDLVLTVHDNGCGCSTERNQGTGSTLVAALAQQHGGAVQWEDADPGCRVVVRIPSGRVRGA